jgi:hypothetical protein
MEEQRRLRRALAEIVLLKAPASGALLSSPQVQAGPNNTRILITADADARPGIMSTIRPGESQQALAVYGIPADVSGAVRVEFPPLKFSDPPIIFKGALPPT